MRIDVNRDELQTIIDALVGGVLKCERKTAERLRERLMFQLNGTPSKPAGYTPIRSAQLDAHVKPDKKKNWAYKPHQKSNRMTATEVNHRVELTADQILAGL